MDLAYRLLVYSVAMIGPTLLFLGLMRALEWLRDDALLARIAESDDASPEVSLAAARAIENRDDSPRSAPRTPAGAVRGAPVRTDGGRPDGSRPASDHPDGDSPNSESVVCSTCGEPNRSGATFCRGCVGKL